MMKKVIYALMAFSPVMAFAQDVSRVGSLIDQIQSIISKIIPIMFALAIIFFFWGLIKFVRGAGDPDKVKEGKGIMIYGVIAIAVMISIYGLVAWLQTTLGVTSPTDTTIPCVPGLPCDRT